MHDALQRVKRATVAIGIMKGTSGKHPYNIVGSGFSVHEKGIVITCAHVWDAFKSAQMKKSQEETIASEKEGKEGRIQIPGSEKPLVETPYALFFETSPDGSTIFLIPVPFGPVVEKTNFDLAMVRLEPHKRFRAGFPIVEIEDPSLIKEGMDVAVYGFPLGEHLQDHLGTISSSLTRGIISAIIPAPGVAQEHLRGFQLNITATHGSSGGPVFSTATGKVLGVLQGGVENTDGQVLPGIVKAEPVYPIFEHDSVAMLLAAHPGRLPSSSPDPLASRKPEQP